MSAFHADFTYSEQQVCLRLVPHAAHRTSRMHRVFSHPETSVTFYRLVPVNKRAAVVMLRYGSDGEWGINTPCMCGARWTQHRRDLDVEVSMTVNTPTPPATALSPSIQPHPVLPTNSSTLRNMLPPPPSASPAFTTRAAPIAEWHPPSASIPPATSTAHRSMQVAQSLPLGPMDAVAARRRDAVLLTGRSKGKKAAAAAPVVSSLHTLLWPFARPGNGFQNNTSLPPTRIHPAHAAILDQQLTLHHLLFRIPLTTDPYTTAAPGTPQLTQFDLRAGFSLDAFVAIVHEHMAFHCLSFPAAPSNDYRTATPFELLEGRKTGETITFKALVPTNGTPLSIALLQRADSKIFTLPVNREPQSLTIVIAPLYGNVLGPTPRHTLRAPCFPRIALAKVPSPTPQTVSWGSACYPDCPPSLAMGVAGGSLVALPTPSSSSGRQVLVLSTPFCLTDFASQQSRIRQRNESSDEERATDSSSQRPTRRTRYEDDPTWEPDMPSQVFVPSVPNRRTTPEYITIDESPPARLRELPTPAVGKLSGTGSQLTRRQELALQDANDLHDLPELGVPSAPAVRQQAELHDPMTSALALAVAAPTNAQSNTTELLDEDVVPLSEVAECLDSIRESVNSSAANRRVEIVAPTQLAAAFRIVDLTTHAARREANPGAAFVSWAPLNQQTGVTSSPLPNRVTMDALLVPLRRGVALGHDVSNLAVGDGPTLGSFGAVGRAITTDAKYWQQGASSELFRPVLGQMSTPERRIVFAGHGKALAAALINTGVGVLPVSPWTWIALLNGRDAILELSPRVIFRLDEGAGKLIEALMAWHADSPIPTDPSHPIISMLIGTFPDAQPETLETPREASSHQALQDAMRIHTLLGHRDPFEHRDWEALRDGLVGVTTPNLDQTRLCETAVITTLFDRRVRAVGDIETHIEYSLHSDVVKPSTKPLAELFRLHLEAYLRGVGHPAATAHLFAEDHTVFERGRNDPLIRARLLLNAALDSDLMPTDQNWNQFKFMASENNASLPSAFKFSSCGRTAIVSFNRGLKELLLRCDLSPESEFNTVAAGATAPGHPASSTTMPAPTLPSSLVAPMAQYAQVAPPTPTMMTRSWEIETCRKDTETRLQETGSSQLSPHTIFLSLLGVCALSYVRKLLSNVLNDARIDSTIRAQAIASYIATLQPETFSEDKRARRFRTPNIDLTNTDDEAVVELQNSNDVGGRNNSPVVAAAPSPTLTPMRASQVTPVALFLMQIIESSASIDGADTPGPHLAKDVGPTLQPLYDHMRLHCTTALQGIHEVTAGGSQVYKKGYVDARIFHHIQSICAQFGITYPLRQSAGTTGATDRISTVPHLTEFTHDQIVDVTWTLFTGRSAKTYQTTRTQAGRWVEARNRIAAYFENATSPRVNHVDTNVVRSVHEQLSLLFGPETVLSSVAAAAPAGQLIRSSAAEMERLIGRALNAITAADAGANA
uniref:HECT domain-containing protein n=1 Tax=Mycena chlorophos TaxID=658473 RepID=A0ABQ0KYQ5_MYCCL|nr:predicted protein [Mycena chlorophos]